MNPNEAMRTTMFRALPGSGEWRVWREVGSSRGCGGERHEWVLVLAAPALLLSMQLLFVAPLLCQGNCWLQVLQAT